MTDIGEWSDLDEIFVAIIRGRRPGSEFITVSSHAGREDQAATDVEMVLDNNTQELGEAFEPDVTSGKKRQADRDPSPDVVFAHERAKKKQRRWSRKQNKKAKMHAWMQAAGLEVPTITATMSPPN